MFLQLFLVLTLSCFAEAAKLPKIVGGVSTTIANHPWQVSLRRQSSHICGATIIDNEWAITAAHCVDPTLSYEIGYGHENLNSQSIITVSEVIQHGGYNDVAPYPNDIALLRLAGGGIQYSSSVSRLPLAADEMSLSNCMISGWGLTGFLVGIFPISTDVLQEVSIQHISREQCDGLWQQMSISESHICLLEATKSACSGDSGGPLTCTQNGHSVLAGATSWGLSSCDGSLPSVYTRVSKYLTWVSEVTGISTTNLLN